MHRLFFACLIFLSFAAEAVWAKPIKVESENIVLYGDVNEEAAQDIVRELEIYRRTIFALVKKKPNPAEVKLTIYSFDSSRPLSKFFGNKNTAGLYTIGADGPVFFTSVKKSSRKDSFEEQVAKHEFSHHILHAIVEDDFPRWYDEGFANYLASFSVEDDVITIGAPNVAHGAALERQRWMSPEDVFRSIKLYPWAKRGEGRSRLVDSFYAQSWLYVHFMQNHPEYSSALPKYLQLLKQNMDSLQAFEMAFGISPKDYHNRAKKYFGANAFPVVQFKAEPKFLNVKMDTTNLSQAQLDLEMLTGQGNILSKENKKNYKKRLDSAQAGLGEAPRILMAQAKFSVLEDEYDEAVTLAERLNAKEPNSIEILRLLGDAYKGRSQQKRFADLRSTDLRLYEDNADLQSAIKNYESVLKMNPKDRRTVQSIVRLYGRYEKPANAIAKTAIQYYEGELFSGRSAHTMMDLANIYMGMGQSDRACSYFNGAKMQVISEKSADKSDIDARTGRFAALYIERCSG